MTNTDDAALVRDRYIAHKPYQAWEVWDRDRVMCVCQGESAARLIAAALNHGDRLMKASFKPAQAKP